LLEPGATRRGRLDLPPELRNRITRFEIAGERSAGAVTLTDDALQRREVALIDAQGEDEGQALLSPLHYLRQALAPTADLMEGAPSDMLLASPDALILADVATLSPDEETALIDWVERGGSAGALRRAAPGGVRCGARRRRSADAGAAAGRRAHRGRRHVLGRAQGAEPVPRDLAVLRPRHPRDVTVESQVMAQPDPDLSERTIASLTDGTPLVTRAPLGQG
jgi:hypothetical protein